MGTSGGTPGYWTNYPKCVFFILGNEFCERFSYYGMRAILVIYLNEALNFSEGDSSSIYHAFVFACYFMPLFGAMIADGWLGKYKTIFFISIIYAIGNIVMSATAFPIEYAGTNKDGEEIFGPSKAGAIVGLLLIAVGTGGIKPCVSAFGGDQFTADQGKQLATFFAVFYMSINIGSVMSIIVTPILRKIQCYGSDCYPIAFGVPAGLMVAALVFFIIGTRWYKKSPPKENIIGKLFGCVGKALVNRCRSGKSDYCDHWLDYAKPEYDHDFVEDTKAVMRVLFLYIPLPVFWALFEQQGSRWTLQAGQMSGKTGNIHLQQEQIQAINPICVIVLVPIMEAFFFPCLNKLKIPNRPLQRLGAGMVLAAVAFIMCGILQDLINNTQPPAVKEGHASLTFINTATGHQANVTFRGSSTILPPSKSLVDQELPIGNMQNITFTVSFNDSQQEEQFIEAFDRSCYTIFLKRTATKFKKIEMNRKIRPGKSESEWRVINTLNQTVDFEFNTTEGMGAEEGSVNASFGKSRDVYLKQGKYSLYVDGVKVGETVTETGSVNTVVVYKENSQVKVKIYEDISPNEIHMLWQVPQYFVITVGEVLFSVTGLSFAYSQAPESMKAVLQAAWLLTNAFGNIIVVVVVKGIHLANRAHEFYLFAGLMFATVIIFALMSWTYVYVEDRDREEGLDELDASGKKLPKEQDVANQTKHDYSKDNLGFDPNSHLSELNGKPRHEYANIDAIPRHHYEGLSNSPDAILPAYDTVAKARPNFNNTDL